MSIDDCHPKTEDRDAQELEWADGVRAQFGHVDDIAWLNETVFSGNAVLNLLTSVNSRSQVLCLTENFLSIQAFISERAGHLYTLATDNSLCTLNSELKQHHNITYIRKIENSPFPFDDQTLDMIFLFKLPSQSMLLTLKRVLKESGQIILLANNKYSYHALADKLSRKQRNTTFRKEMSKQGYLKQLSTAGFDEIECHGVDISQSQILTLKANLPFVETTDNASSSIKTKLKNSILFSPAFCFIASFGGKKIDSLLLKLYYELQQKFNYSHLIFSQITITGKSKAIFEVNSDCNQYMVKIPFDQNGFKGEKQSQEVLRELDQILEFSVNHPVDCFQGQIDDCHYFVESKCEGISLRDAVKLYGREHFAGEIFTVWQKLAFEPSFKTRKVVDEPFFAKIAGNAANKIMTLTSYQDEMAQVASKLKQDLMGTELSLGLIHGDFSISNSFTVDGKITALIDWESAENQGVVFIDLINIYTSIERFLHPQTDVVDNLLALVSGQWRSSSEWDYLEQAKQLLHISEPQFKALLIVYFFWGMSQQLETDFQYNLKAINVRVRRIFELVETFL